MTNKDEIKEIVIARLQAMPERMKISIGNFGTFSKYDLIDHVKRETPIGKKVVEIQMKYLRSLKKFAH